MTTYSINAPVSPEVRAEMLAILERLRAGQPEHAARFVLSADGDAVGLTSPKGTLTIYASDPQGRIYYCEMAGKRFPVIEGYHWGEAPAAV